MPLKLSEAVRVINAGGVIALLVCAVYLGANGYVVSAGELQDCRTVRDFYLRVLLDRTARDQPP